MADVHSSKTRSFNMSRIRGKNTGPELVVRRYLYKNGFRYRLHSKELPGKPDIVLKKYNLVIFIHGCFWHGHDGCSLFNFPATRSKWWRKKINGTKLRDKLHLESLTKSGWNVLTIWECELCRDKIESTFSKLMSVLGNADEYPCN